MSCDSPNQSVALRLRSSQVVWRAGSYPLVGFAVVALAHSALASIGYCVHLSPGYVVKKTLAWI